MLGKMYAKTDEFKRSLLRAQRIVEKALAQESNGYVAISGGKDSIAMLGVVASVCGKSLPAWVHLSDASFPGTRETCEEACEKLGVELIVDESPVSAFDVIGQQSSKQFGKKGFFFDAIKKVCKKHRLAFVGVRAAESKRRMQAAKAGPIFESSVPAKHLKCHPILYFSIQDVFAAISYFDLPVHPIYFKRPLSDKPIRLGYITALDLLEKNTALFVKVNYPELYTKLEAAYPEVRRYV
jgi:3'-phosphoadenosine 5'-phosphosulfate sulfotransferase (PAPS reductase)/FAD synthetase